MADRVAVLVQEIGHLLFKQSGLRFRGQITLLVIVGEEIRFKKNIGRNW
jgi:hypothetical protein